MSWNLVSANQFEQHIALWDELNRSGVDSPLLQGRFVAQCIASFSEPDSTLAIYSDNDKPVYAAIVHPSGVGRWQTFQPSQSPLGMVVCHQDHDLLDLSSRLLKQLGVKSVLMSLTRQDPGITPRPADGATLDTIDYIDTARITIDKSFQEYWQSRGKNLKHNMKRQKNRLGREEVNVELVKFTRPDEMADAISAYASLESAGWKGQEGSAVTVDGDQGRFYQALLESYAETGDAIVYALRYDSRIVALDVCVRNAREICILKTTYDETIKTSSPALLMRLASFEELFADPTLKTIEFYGRVMDWHTKWSDEIRTMYEVNIYANSLVAAGMRKLRAMKNKGE